MTDFERDRLNRYIQDAEKWLLVIAEGLRYPETPAQAAAASMTRAAIELVAGVRQQMIIDSNNKGVC
ncbi:hypothetical protein [Sporomusa sphaeroides]|uniref:Uncharacterized protein n=1 Tax=Sporomusa sphaeroides DSM 2875 TaxID=1337886 RepID=A0ABP2C2N3_9FIRM|nr:hypothetical protein [Sporomusa sphaeroides]OLS56824.1 hypothetical protein SPSPH_03140 [Sporomusa sphaeroides DSM 2875]CVK18771.1 hypothetical protein SSPH_01415 [Sporomusa sphaeroides DSM 2875]